jgi:hypothetical protein
VRESCFTFRLGNDGFLWELFDRETLDVEDTLTIDPMASYSILVWPRGKADVAILSVPAEGTSSDTFGELGWVWFDKLHERLGELT